MQFRRGRVFVAPAGASEYSLGRKPQVVLGGENQAPPGYAVKDISTPWEGEAPAEPQAFIDPRKTMRLGGSLALPSTRITNWVVLMQ